MYYARNKDRVANSNIMSVKVYALDPFTLAKYPAIET